MTAALILGINLFIAGIFAVTFAVVAAISRTAQGAKWIALGYATGITTIIFEYLLPFQSNPVPVGVAAFLTYLLAMTFCVIGVARHYRLAPRLYTMAAIWTASILLIPVTFSINYASPVRVVLYQSPYLAMQLLVLVVLVRSGRRHILDLLLAGVFVMAALIYISRPLIALHMGQSDVAQGYMATSYAAVSQSLGAGTLIAQALVMLLVMMRDTAAEMLATSETDPLSGVLNRRGFIAHAERALVAAHERAQAAVLVVADIDFFKAVNDEFGHAAGDRVIAHFADLLRRSVRDTAVIARPGGEEFAVLLVDCDLAEARAYAELVRRNFSERSDLELGIGSELSASFGIAAMMPGDELSEIWRRADAAMYRAKAGGRDCVNVALQDRQIMSVVSAAQ